jgi:hypothetical protein
MLPPSHVVVMGDLVKSEAAASVEILHRRFNAAVDAANAAFAPSLASPLTITLGDEFQGLATSLQTGTAIMRFIRWQLLEENIECRFVVGLVSLSTSVNPVLAWNMMGPGLSLAREKLEQKRAPNAYRFSLVDAPTPETLMESIGLALTDIEARWTDRQRQVALAAMRADETSATLAEQFDVNASVFYKVRRAANFDLYRTLWTNLFEALRSIDMEQGLR